MERVAFSTETQRLSLPLYAHGGEGAEAEDRETAELKELGRKREEGSSGGRDEIHHCPSVLGIDM